MGNTISGGSTASAVAGTQTVTLAQFRRDVELGVVHSDGFTAAKLDGAIAGCMNRFQRKAKVMRTVTDVSISEGDDSFDPTATAGLERFLSGHLYREPFITSPTADKYRRLHVKSFDTLSKLYRQSPGSTGRPEVITFDASDKAYLYPKADQAYTISIPWCPPITFWKNGARGTWASGTAYRKDDWIKGDGTPDALIYQCIVEHTASALNEPPNSTYWKAVSGVTYIDPETFEIEVPSQYYSDIAWWGARAFLLLGAPGHPDGGPAMREFDAFCAEVRGEAHEEGTWEMDRHDGFENAFVNEAYL